MGCIITQHYEVTQYNLRIFARPLGAHITCRLQQCLVNPMPGMVFHRHEKYKLPELSTKYFTVTVH